MSRRKKIVLAAAGAALVLVWLLCLPRQLFGTTPYSTVVTAAGGELLGARVADDGQWRFPPCDSLPAKFAAALIEYEDRGFYSHCGVSLRGIGRALWQNISNRRVVSGASTITMQTIRLNRRGSRNLWEKGVEMFMATRLEVRFTKDEILRMYASHAPFGGNVVGIGAATWRYLGNDGADMSWAEAATLAVLQNAPSTVHLAKNRPQLLAKRNRLLKRLLDKGAITTDEYELAVDEPLIGTPYPMPSVAPHLVEHYSRESHGQHTATAIDFALQKRLEALTAMWRGELALQGINDLAAVVAEVSTGRVVAYCGNADLGADRHGRWVDIARAPRSSGSILKPLLYCAALQEGIILQNTLLPDIPTDFGGFVPRNFDGAFAGMIEARLALAQSLNVPNVWLLQKYGVSRFAQLLRDCGLTTLTRPARSYGLSLVLGGAEVRLVDVVDCYCRLARFDASFPLNDSVAVYATLDAMRDVNRPDQLDWSRVSSVQNIAWKTGTSYGARDGWAIGITPRYVVGVWVGNASGSGVADLTGARTAGPVMFDVFSLLPQSGWFAEPRGHQQQVCVHSGHLAGKYCADTELLIVSTRAEGSQRCSYCSEVPVSADGLRRVADGSEPMVMRSYFMLPPVHKYFYKKVHADYIEAPALTSADAGALRFIYPADGAAVAMPRKPDGSRAELVCKATHSEPAAQLFWHLDSDFIGATADIHQVQISPAPGLHRLTVYDLNGAAATVEFTVK